MGGIAANNSAGEKTLFYGQTLKYIKSLEVVLSNGELVNFKEIKRDEAVKIGKGDSLEAKLYRDVLDLIEQNAEDIYKAKPHTSKNSSGYYLWEIYNLEKDTINMAKLVCGSQGTLGIITSMTLELVKIKKHSRMLVTFLPNLEHVVTVTEEILKFKPESLESYDDHTFKIAMKFLPQIIWKLKKNILRLAFSFLPEAWDVITGGVPKLIIMAEFTGDSETEVETKVLQAYEQVWKYGYKTKYTKNKNGAEKYWLFRRESFNLLRNKLSDLRTAPYIEDTVVSIKHLKEFIPEMENILNKHDLLYTIAGHVGNGNFHIIPLTSFKKEVDGDMEIEKMKQVMHEVFAMIKHFNGSISGEHNDGLIRTPFLPYMFDNKVLELFKKVKNTFDPKNILNPNKKVGGSLEENFGKIDRTK
jgi:FAD/FMN-containing dehydrogenase